MLISEGKLVNLGSQLAESSLTYNVKHESYVTGSHLGKELKGTSMLAQGDLVTGASRKPLDCSIAHPRE